MPASSPPRPTSRVAFGVLLLGLAASGLAAPLATSDTRPADEPGVATAANASSSVPSAALELAPALCLDRLDAAVRLAANGDEEDARHHLERLAARCAHLPQIQHDLGVLAARAGRTEEAIAAFEASLNADPRAAGTLEQLRALHRREAALAYARALGAAQPPAFPPPPLALQDSTDVNADSLRAPADPDGLREPSTIEYELYAWWHSADDESAEAWLDHYAADYPPSLANAERSRAGRPRWASMHREIAFTARDAVAVLEQRGASASPWRRLLLLRLQGNRWKIYRETPL